VHSEAYRSQHNVIHAIKMKKVNKNTKTRKRWSR